MQPGSQGPTGLTADQMLQTRTAANAAAADVQNDLQQQQQQPSPSTAVKTIREDRRKYNKGRTLGSKNKPGRKHNRGFRGVPAAGRAAAPQTGEAAAAAGLRHVKRPRRLSYEQDQSVHPASPLHPAAAAAGAGGGGMYGSGQGYHGGHSSGPAFASDGLGGQGQSTLARLTHAAAMAEGMGSRGDRSRPDDYYQVYAEYYAAQEAYNRLTSSLAGNPLMHSLPQPELPEKLYGAAYAGRAHPVTRMTERIDPDEPHADDLEAAETLAAAAAAGPPAAAAVGDGAAAAAAAAVPVGFVPVSGTGAAAAGAGGIRQVSRPQSPSRS